jgi:ABC-type phosphonate transport system ATPase subunit
MNGSNGEAQQRDMAAPAPLPPMLELNGVHKRFGGLHAVNNVSFKVAPGNIKAVIGPNGAGKTTLFNLIAGNLPVSAGAITFHGREIQGKKTHQIARYGPDLPEHQALSRYDRPGLRHGGAARAKPQRIFCRDVQPAVDLEGGAGQP